MKAYAKMIKSASKTMRGIAYYPYLCRVAALAIRHVIYVTGYRPLYLTHPLSRKFLAFEAIPKHSTALILTGYVLEYRFPVVPSVFSRPNAVSRPPALAEVGTDSKRLSAAPSSIHRPPYRLKAYIPPVSGLNLLLAAASGCEYRRDGA